jgi:predicted nucleic acid-binding protein
MFVLDTNVISELRHGKPKQSPAVRAWATGQLSSSFYLSTITLLELEMGVQALERKTPQPGSALRNWIGSVRAAFRGRILSFTENTAPICASLHIPNPRSDREAMIAATAIEHGFTVATRNEIDFAQTGVKIINPWRV